MQSLPRVSILVVDDRPENLLALEASLEPLGQEIVAVDSGTAALRAVLAAQFAVILMDIKMPGMDGFETLALLRQRERSRHIPIIFLSAYPEHAHALQSYASGAVDYILKPFDPATLRSKVSVFVTLRQNELLLEAAHAELERRVHERTAELAAANVALEREIRDRKAMEQQLIDQAHRDGLTGLANRALLLEHLSRAFARSRRRSRPSFAVMLLDLDRFKVVNDSLGHLAGDRLLVEVAHRLQSCLREVDTAARIGGDEFAVLVDGIDELRDATRLADRIQKRLGEPFDMDGKEVFTSASIGIAMMSPRAEVAEQLLRDADVAMYRAKEAGRARCAVFDQEMHASLMDQLHLEAELARALERDELFLLYQPILALRERRLVGFEALLRWRHPERGLVMPATFIPIAEETGLIRPIGRWVLEAACRQLAAWPSDTLTMNINVSAQQMAHFDFTADVKRVLADTGLPASRLTLEITESTIMARGAVSDQIVAELHAQGVALCLDDFGTGYSCLSYLHELPVSGLKIDRSFVQRIGGSHERAEIVRSIVTLALNLGMTVTAEGVENAEQVERLEELACEHVQGFFFARPLDAAAAGALIEGGAVAPRIAV
ncbi:MAG: EAL domain-containing protein [Myxococcota bacterium]|nr:EAL domain-containing protein [Myxococcota bacterium]